MLIGKTGVCGLVTVIQSPSCSPNAEQLLEPPLQLGTGTAGQENLEKCKKMDFWKEGLLLGLPRALQHCFGDRRVRRSHTVFKHILIRHI